MVDYLDLDEKYLASICELSSVILKLRPSREKEHHVHRKSVLYYKALTNTLRPPNSDLQNRQPDLG